MGRLGGSTEFIFRNNFLKVGMLLFIWKNVLEAGSMVHSCKNVLKGGDVTIYLEECFGSW